MTLDELNTELQKTFNAFKAENDKLQAEIQKHGSASATTASNVAKLNDSLDELQDQMAKLQKQSDAIETKLNRPDFGQAADKVEAAQKNLDAFNLLTGRTNTAEQYAAYKVALNTYLRRGDKAAGADVMNTLSVGSDPEGGFWCPPDMSGRIVQKVYESSPIRQLASVQPIGGDLLEGYIDNDENDAGWVAEQGSREDSTDEAKIGKWQITAHEMWAQPKATQKMLDDANVNVETWLVDKGGSKFGRLESTAFVSGNASGKPRGFLDRTFVSTDDATRAWGQLQYIASGASGAWAASNAADVLLDAVYAVKDQYLNGAAWLMKRSTVASVRKLKDGQGNYLWVPGSATEPATLHGYPVFRAADMPVIAANSLSIAFGNFREAYQIVDRAGIRVLRDPYTQKGFVKFYMTKRTGGDVVNSEALKVIKFAAS